MQKDIDPDKLALLATMKSMNELEATVSPESWGRFVAKYSGCKNSDMVFNLARQKAGKINN